MQVVEPQTLKGRSDVNFDAFWDKVEQLRESLELDEPSLPCKRKTPARFQVSD